MGPRVGHGLGNCGDARSHHEEISRGRYTELQLEVDERYVAGSLQLGVTSTTPESVQVPLKSVFHLPHTRIIDVYGQVWVTKETSPVYGYPVAAQDGDPVSNWDTFCMPSGTKIGALLRPDGLLLLCVNRAFRCSVPTEIEG